MDNLGDAFSFPFKGKDWFSKFALGAVFMVLCLFIVGFFILAGYYVRVTQRVMKQEEPLLPEWDDIGGKLVLGFKFCLVYLIYTLPIILLYIPLVAMAIIGEISGQQEAAGIFTGIYTLGLFVLVIPYSLLLYAFMPIITYRFAERESIGDALDIGTLFKLFAQNWQDTLIVALIAVGVHSFAWVGIIGFFIGVFFTIMYAYLISSFLFGTLYRSRRDIVPVV